MKKIRKMATHTG